MALYHKKLHSLDELEREKKALRKEIERMDNDESLSVGGLGGGLLNRKKKGDKEDGGFSLSGIIDMLPISSPVTAGLLKLVTDRVLKRRDRRRDDRDYEAPKPKGPGAVRKAAVELLGGYLKWKAIELSYKGVKHLVKKRKEKREYEDSLKYLSENNR